MIDIKEKEDCCGCYGCINICPKRCIYMEKDNEGFWYPIVDKSICIDCGLCEKVCPIINTIKKKYMKIIAYACKNKDERIRETSSSGGVFNLLCKYTINKGGVVFGACFDKNFDVIHTYSETLDECDKFKGSKYVQSKIGDTYKQAEEFLSSGRTVLFSGTQCQIKGLNLYLKKKYDNLISVDIVCHGVPSPKVFKLYRDSLIKKYRNDIKDIGFRDKVNGWKEFSYVTEFKNGQIYSATLKQDTYMRGFLKDLYLRPSCYKCNSKNYTNGSDISLADYWGIENKHPKFDDDKGTSLLLLNSINGQDVFNSVSCNMEFIKTDLDYAISNNPCIIRPVNYNPKREEFFKKINDINIEKIINRSTKVTFIQKIRRKAFGLLRKIKNSIT